MTTYLREKVERVEDEDDRDYVRAFGAEEVAPFCPEGTPDSPCVTLDSAMDVVDRYCNLLPNDGISMLQCITWWEMTGAAQFKGYIKLPMNGVIRKVVEGIPMSNRGQARNAAYYEAAKELYEANALDDKLVPVRPSIPPKINAFFAGIFPNDEATDVKGGKTILESTAEEDALNQDSHNTIKKAKTEFIPFKMPKEWYKTRIPRVFQGRFVMGQRYSVYRICMTLEKLSGDYKWPNIFKFQDSSFSYGIISSQDIPDVGSFPLYGSFGRISVRLEKVELSIKVALDNLRILSEFQVTLFKDLLDLVDLNFLVKKRIEDLPFAIIPLIRGNDNKWSVNADLFKEIHQVSKAQDLRAPRHEIRENAARRRGNLGAERRKAEWAKYEGALVLPWYQKGRNKTLYIVDSIEYGMTPNSQFSGGYYNSSPVPQVQFHKEQNKMTIYDLEQPLLKCKIAGIGLGQKQLNYLLEKPEKEDEFPVYLVPELVHIIPLPSTLLAQLKFLPSVLHRLYRLHMSRELLIEVAEETKWNGALRFLKEASPFDIERYNLEQKLSKEKNEERKSRGKPKPANNTIPDRKEIENRDLHYEFIHPNDIKMRDIQLFHQAVSGHHAARKLTNFDVNPKDLVDEDLFEHSKIELKPMGEINLPSLESPLNAVEDRGPSLLTIMEAITHPRANEGISYERIRVIGTSFLNYLVSGQIFTNFPNWTEPMMCQLRNRVLSYQYISHLGKKKGIGAILAGCDFRPRDIWTPSGFQLLPNIGEVAAKYKVHFGVYSGIRRELRNKTAEELEEYVRIQAYLLQDDPENDENGRIRSRQTREKPAYKFGTFSHGELADVDLANSVCALVGAFFMQTGPSGAMKFLDWLEFKIPNTEEGSEGDLLGRFELMSLREPKEEVEINSKIDKILPGIHLLEAKIGYKFKDRRNVLEAFCHPTFPANDLTECYQKLEFLGDAILDLLLTQHVYSLSSVYTADQLYDIRGALVNNITYGSLAVRYELNKYLLSISKSLLDMIDNFVVHQEANEHHVLGHYTLISDEDCWGPKHMEVPKVLGDIFESLAGAIYIDSGKSIDTVYKVFYRLMSNEIDCFTEEVPKSPIRELNENYPGQIKFRSTTSTKIRARGREMVKIDVGKIGYFYGSGTSKSRARDAAAKIALKLIKEDNEFVLDHGSRLMILQ